MMDFRTTRLIRASGTASIEGRIFHEFPARLQLPAEFER
jgi:hypothetical protein